MRLAIERLKIECVQLVRLFWGLALREIAIKKPLRKRL
jgi:hypothetical protein